ncbi:MAG: ARMT1-like domain-containing protein [Candidatus Methanofastidiosia archaeon]|jgi:uncharacterized protein with ATP-grasp and redox domains
MKVHLDCVPCFLEQALQAARFVTDDETKQEKAVRTTLQTLEECDYRKTPPEISHAVHFTLMDVLKADDPYKKVKENNNVMVLDMYDQLKKDVNSSDDPVDTAIRLSIAGNIMDYGARLNFELSETIDTVKKVVFAIDDTEQLKKDLKKGKTIAYLADNAGEIVFDRLFMETVNEAYGKKEWHVYVKGRPILNDATIKDAEQVGLTNMGTVRILELPMEKEYDSRADPVYLKEFNENDVVISKGQGNYEALSNVANSKFYFMLMVKCGIVADDVGADIGDIIVMNP